MADAIIMVVEGVRTRASTSEVLVTFAVPMENAALVSTFMAKVGRQLACAFAEVEADKPLVRPEPKSLYGEQARALKLSGFFRTPDVWRALGSDDSYRAWIQKQPSAWSGEFSEFVDGEGRCEAAHVRRIETGAGMQIKNDYACIPLTHAEHKAQSDHGEGVFTAVTFDGKTKSEDGELIEGRNWMERQRIKYVEAWAWEQLKKDLGVASMADAKPIDVYKWASFLNLDKYLPPEYRKP